MFEAIGVVVAIFFAMFGFSFGLEAEPTKKNVIIAFSAFGFAFAIVIIETIVAVWG